MDDQSSQVVWLREPGAYRYLGLGTDTNGWQLRNDTYPEGISDAEFLSRWSKWQEFDHTIRWFGHDGDGIDPGLGGLRWGEVAYTQVNPEPGVVVRGRHDPRKARASGEEPLRDPGR